MITDFDVYVAFRKAQSNAKNRPYRLPKNWENHKNKMAKNSVDNLKICAEFFNTKWDNIDIENYMDCGFDLFKNFTYHQFLDKKILNHYIQKDKNKKISLNFSKKNILESAKFVKLFMKDHNYTDNYIFYYGKLRNDNKSLPISHFLSNTIDKYFLVWMIRDKFLILEDNDRALINMIIREYRDLCADLKQMDNFIKKIRSFL